MSEISKTTYSNAHAVVSSRLDEVAKTTDSIVCTINNLKEADTRFQKLLVDHEERNSEAFLDIYSNIKTLSQISEQADMHLCQELERNEEKNKIRLKRIKYALIISGIANIISITGHVIFYILTYCI